MPNPNIPLNTNLNANNALNSLNRQNQNGLGAISLSELGANAAAGFGHMGGLLLARPFTNPYVPETALISDIFGDVGQNLATNLITGRGLFDGLDFTLADSISEFAGNYYASQVLGLTPGSFTSDLTSEIIEAHSSTYLNNYLLARKHGLWQPGNHAHNQNLLTGGFQYTDANGEVQQAAGVHNAVTIGIFNTVGSHIGQKIGGPLGGVVFGDIGSSIGQHVAVGAEVTAGDVVNAGIGGVGRHYGGRFGGKYGGKLFTSIFGDSYEAEALGRVAGQFAGQYLGRRVAQQAGASITKNLASKGLISAKTSAGIGRIAKFAGPALSIGMAGYQISKGNYWGAIGSVAMLNPVTGGIFTVADGVKSLVQGDIGRGVGTLAGAAIGTFILPGIGTIIGGMLGGLIGGIFGGKKKARKKLRKRLTKMIKKDKKKEIEAAKKDAERAIREGKIAYLENPNAKGVKKDNPYMTKVDPDNPYAPVSNPDRISKKNEDKIKQAAKKLVKKKRDEGNKLYGEAYTQEVTQAYVSTYNKVMREHLQGRKAPTIPADNWQQAWSLQRQVRDPKELEKTLKDLKKDIKKLEKKGDKLKDKQKKELEQKKQRLALLEKLPKDTSLIGMLEFLQNQQQGGQRGGQITRQQLAALQQAAAQGNQRAIAALRQLQAQQQGGGQRGGQITRQQLAALQQAAARGDQRAITALRQLQGAGTQRRPQSIQGRQQQTIQNQARLIQQQNAALARQIQALKARLASVQNGGSLIGGARGPVGNPLLNGAGSLGGVNLSQFTPSYFLGLGRQSQLGVPNLALSGGGFIGMANAYQPRMMHWHHPHNRLQLPALQSPMLAQPTLMTNAFATTGLAMPISFNPGLNGNMSLGFNPGISLAA